MSKSTPINQLGSSPEGDVMHAIDLNDPTVAEVLESMNNTAEYYEENEDVRQEDGRQAKLQQVDPFALFDHFAKDIKLTLLVAIIFILTSKIPLEKLIYNYVSLDKIPFSDILVKSVIAGALFFFCARFFT